MADDWFAQNKPATQGGDWFDENKPSSGPSPLRRGVGAAAEAFGGAAKGMLATVGGLMPFQPPQAQLQSLSELGESALPWLGNPTPYGGNMALNVVHGLPFIGPTAAQVASEVGEGKYPEAAGHAGGNLAAMLLAGRLGTPRRGSAAVPAPEAAYTPRYTGTTPGTVVAPEATVASAGYGPLLQRVGNAAVGVASPRIRHTIELGKAAYDLGKEAMGKTELALTPKPLPPPPVPEMNTGGPPIAKYTVTGTANRTPYLANVPKRTAPSAPADLPLPPAPPHPEGAYEIPPEARTTPRGTASPEHYERGARTVKARALARHLKIGGTTLEQAQAMAMDDWKSAAKEAGVTMPSEASIQQALVEFRKMLGK